MYKYLLIFCVAGLTWSCEPSVQIELANDLGIQRSDEAVVLSRETLEQKLGTIPTNRVPALFLNDEFLPCQLDDVDGDGSWDELAFLLDFDAQETITVELKAISAEQLPIFPKRTQVFLGEKLQSGKYQEVSEAVAPVGLDGFPTKYQAEGVGWENDKMAFRVYFDCRNVKDLFGKLKPELILHKAGTPEFGNYHELADWGMDVLHCGSSLGAGGIAILENDSLFRLGSTPVYRYKEIVDGPIRSIFELQYEGWMVNGETLSATERITIWAGSYGFQSDVSVTGFSGIKELATGIVTTKLDKEPQLFSANPDYQALLAHGKQSLNKDILAMAILSPDQEVSTSGQRDILYRSESALGQR